jgi:hypothetical protein
MGYRADPSGIRLEATDAAIVKGMLARGDRQHDIAAWFGVNGGRIADIATGRKFREVLAEPSNNLPPRGPYPTGREAAIALQALARAKAAIASAESVIAQYTN